MDKRVLRCIITAVAFKLSIIAFGLGLVTLLTGVTGNSPKSAPILTFNISSLGLEAYHDVNSPLHENVTSLIPSGISNPSSITQYINAPDWYTMHYYSTCSGFYAPSKSNPSILTANKVNISCVRQVSGYFFNPHDVLKLNLFSSVAGLADEVSTATYYTGTWSGLWYSGMSNCFITIVTLVFNFFCNRPRLSAWACWDAFLSTVLLLASSAMVTNKIVTVHNAHGLPGPNPWSGAFLGVMWITTVLMASVCAFMWTQWSIEDKQWYGPCRNEQRRTDVQSDDIPLQDHKSDKTLVGVQSMK